MHQNNHILPIYADEARIEQRKRKKHRSFRHLIIGLIILASIVGLKCAFWNTANETVKKRELQMHLGAGAAGAAAVALHTPSVAAYFGFPTATAAGFGLMSIISSRPKSGTGQEIERTEKERTEKDAFIRNWPTQYRSTKSDLNKYLNYYDFDWQAFTEWSESNDLAELDKQVQIWVQKQPPSPPPSPPSS